MNALPKYLGHAQAGHAQAGHAQFYLSGNGVAITLSVDVGWKNSMGIFLDHFMGKIIIIMYRLVL